MRRRSNAGIFFAITVLICAILALWGIFVLFDGSISTDGTPNDSSSSTTEKPGDNSSSDNDNSSSEDDNSSSDDDSSSSSDDSSSSEGDSSSSGGSGETPGGDHLNGKATLNRVGLTGYRMEGGTMVAFTDNSTVDFSNMTSENLFGIREGETVVPGCKFTATMELVNDGNFALDYWMEVRMTSGFDSALAQQLKVTLTVNGVEYSTIVGQPIGGERAPLGQIAKGEKVTFTLSVEFVESKDNNAAQGQTVSFDLYVTTTQAS